MENAETSSGRLPESPEAATDRLPHFDITGFEKLPAETQELYLRIPVAALDQARPIIEREIGLLDRSDDKEKEGAGDIGEGKARDTRARTRETQASKAITDFKAAERGDKAARDRLSEHERELLGTKPDDDEILSTILENQGSGLFSEDEVLEVTLTDPEAKETRKVLEVFKEFRGELPSVDDALKPSLQIDLFEELTKGMGGMPERLPFLRHALNVLTNGGTQTLDIGLRHWGLIQNGDVFPEAVKRFRASLQETPRQT